MTEVIDHRRQQCLRQLSEHRRQDHDGQHHAGCDDEAGQLRLVAGSLARGHGADASIDREATGQSAHGIGATEGDELLVRVDAVTMAVGECARGGQGLGEGQEHDPGRTGGKVGHVAQADRGQARCGHPTGDAAHHHHTFPGQVEGGRQGDGADDRDQRAGDAPVDAARHEDDGHGRQAEREADEVGLGQLSHEPDQLVDDVAVSTGHAEELG